MSDPRRPALAVTVAPLEPGASGHAAELQLRLPSDVARIEEAIELLAGELARHFEDQRAIAFNVRVVLAEALANAILYGNRSHPDKYVQVRARVGPHHMELHVEDEGTGFDPGAVPDPTAPDRIGNPDGRGIFLIHRLMDDVHFNERGNVVSMTLRRRVGRLEGLIDALSRLAGASVEVWHLEDARAHTLSGEPRSWAPAPIGPEAQVISTPDGPAWLEPVPANPTHWVQVGPGADAAATRPPRARAAATVVCEILRSEQEASQVAAELATRYEEIDLLYTISDILGRTVNLEEAAQTIAREVADVVGARRVSILVHDEGSHTMRMVAGRGLETYNIDPVRVDDPTSISAQVFREQRMLAYDRGSPGTFPVGGPERGYLGRSFIALPIVYAPPGGEPRPVGVINLTDRIGDDVFTAGHKKLLAAIANQVGAAIANARLVEGERRRVRLDTELMLAKHLQTALMQPQARVAGGGEIAARTQSAETVGGDFYKFLSRSRGVGVMVGDVSSHGLSAAMLMAHVIAAAGIVAQDAREPERALGRLLEVVGGELARAEMHVAMFYAVINRRGGTLRYANAGHPHAFVLRQGEETERLGATAPPLGLGNTRVIDGRRVAFDRTRDLLCVFSDGFPDAVGVSGSRYGEERLLALVRSLRAFPVEHIVDAAFADLEAFAGDRPADDRTLVLVRG